MMTTTTVLLYFDLRFVELKVVLSLACQNPVMQKERRRLRSAIVGRPVQQSIGRLKLHAGEGLDEVKAVSLSKESKGTLVAATVAKSL